MRILLISEFFPTGKELRFSGGVESRNFFLAKYLAKRNQVFVLTSRIFGTSQKERMAGFTIHRVGPKRSYTPTIGDFFQRIRFMMGAINFGKSLDIEIIDGSNFITHFVAKMIAINKKIPVVAWYPDVWLGSWIKNTGSFGILGEILERINLFLGFDSYIAISSQTFKKLKKYVGGKVYLIHCGVNLKEFNITTRKMPIPTIISVARLTKYKNLKILILAFTKIIAKIKNAQLIIVGTGPEIANLKELTRILLVTSKVKFLSNLPRKELIKLIKSSHLFCLPSTVEGFGITVVEAAACGVPYVISDIKVFKEVTKNGQGGLLFKEGDVKDFTIKIEKLLTDKKLYAKKSNEGLILAKNYQWRDVTRKTEELYRTLLRFKRSELK